MTPLTDAHQSLLERPHLTNLMHLYTYINQPFHLSFSHTQTLRYSSLGDISLLPQLFSAFSSLVLRVQYWREQTSGTSTMLKILLGIAGNQVFGERFDATTPSRMTISSTSWWSWWNIYVLYFLVVERLHPSISWWLYLCSSSEHQDRLD
jgi:hypothetical protein